METNETAWKILAGALAALITGLLGLVGHLVNRINGRTPQDRLMLEELRRDLDGLVGEHREMRTELHRLATAEQVRQEIKRGGSGV